MKKHITLFAIIVAALVAAPASLRAEDKPAKPEASQSAEHAPKKKGVVPFHGKVAAVDATAATVSAGSRTFNITSETKITKNGKPATLADISVGEKIGGAYKKTEAGKLNAVSIRIGEKPEKAEGKKTKKEDKE